MADHIKTNTSRLADDSGRVKNYIRDLKEQKSALDQGIKTLNSMWEGEAYQAFRSAVQDDLNALQTVIDNLNNVYDYEQRAKSEYENCEKRVSRLVDSIYIKEV